jgi:hypothetical protein
VDWIIRPDDAPPTWLVDELAGRLGGVGIAVRFGTGEVVAGGLDDMAQDRTTLTLEVGSGAVAIQSAAVVAYALLAEVIDHSDELRGG